MSRYRIIDGRERNMGAYKRSLPRLDDPALPHVSGEGQPSTHEIDDGKIPIFDQGRIGSCTANGGAFQVAWLAWKKLGTVMIFARLFLYALTRYLEGTPLWEDSGCEPRDVFLALAQFGIVEERLWPYDDGPSRFTMDPPPALKQEGAKHPALMFYECSALATIKQSLLDDFPVGFGTTLYENFESDDTARSGVATMPKPGEKIIGGHYMVIVGYNDDFVFPDGDKGGFKVRNSWGPSWGRSGYVWIPYSYWIKGLASENWTLRRETI